MSRLSILVPALLVALLGAPAQADPYKAVYEVRITNLTKAQNFTPILVATHKRAVRLFELGAPASPELALLAEDGATGPLSEALGELGADEVLTIPGLLGPGETATTQIRAGRFRRRLSVAAMLIPSNDTFFAHHQA